MRMPPAPLRLLVLVRLELMSKQVVSVAENALNAAHTTPKCSITGLSHSRAPCASVCVRARRPEEGPEARGGKRRWCWWPAERADDRTRSTSKTLDCPKSRAAGCLHCSPSQRPRSISPAPRSHVHDGAEAAARVQRGDGVVDLVDALEGVSDVVVDRQLARGDAVDELRHVGARLPPEGRYREGTGKVQGRRRGYSVRCATSTLRRRCRSSAGR